MKLSVSLPDEDVAALDAYAQSAGLTTRSAALQHAVRMLRQARLADDYEAAWTEWVGSGARDAWASTAPDGLVDDAR